VSQIGMMQHGLCQTCAQPNSFIVRRMIHKSREKTAQGHITAQTEHIKWH
jgi:hypothetical protein